MIAIDIHFFSISFLAVIYLNLNVFSIPSYYISPHSFIELSALLSQVVDMRCEMEKR